MSFSGPCQTVSIILNFIILFGVSCKVHFSHRLPNPAKPYSSTHKLLATSSVLIQLLGHLSAWIIITVHIQEFVVLCIFISILISFLILKCFVLKPGIEVDEEVWSDAAGRFAADVDSIYWTAIFSSWVAPVTVWWDSFTLRFYKSHSTLNEHSTNRRKYFTLISSITTATTVFVFLLISISIIDASFDFDDSKDFNLTNGRNETLDVWPNFNVEETTDLLLKKSNPWVFVVILICVAATCLLHVKGKFTLMLKNKDFGIT
jgi:hypothetical protein